LRSELEDKIRELEGWKDDAQAAFDKLVEELEEADKEGDLEDDEDYLAAEDFLEEIDTFLDEARD